MKGLNFRRNHPDGVLFVQDGYIPDEPIHHSTSSHSTKQDLLGYPLDQFDHLGLDTFELLYLLRPQICLPLKRLVQLDTLDYAPRVLVLTAEDTHEGSGQGIDVRVRQAMLGAMAKCF
jgi:hypothetical protein